MRLHMFTVENITLDEAQRHLSVPLWGQCLVGLADVRSSP